MEQDEPGENLAQDMTIRLSSACPQFVYKGQALYT